MTDYNGPERRENLELRALCELTDRSRESIRLVTEAYERMQRTLDRECRERCGVLDASELPFI